MIVLTCSNSILQTIEKLVIAGVLNQVRTARQEGGLSDDEVLALKVGKATPCSLPPDLPDNKKDRQGLHARPAVSAVSCYLLLPLFPPTARHCSGRNSLNPRMAV